MIAILDPLVVDPQDPLPFAMLDPLVRYMCSHRIRIPIERLYHGRLVREFLQPLAKRQEAARAKDPIARRYLDALDQLGHLFQPLPFAPLPGHITVWGFRALFERMGSDWVDLLVRLVSACSLTTEETILITRPIEGRNCRRRSHGAIQMIEKTVWNLRVRAEGRTVRVACVCTPRNLLAPFTTRYDDALPVRGDGASNAFYFDPPIDWCKAARRSSLTGQTEEIRPIVTLRARPVWLDAHGNGWAEPNTPGQHHHWDVYLESPRLVQDYGLGQLNVVRFGAPAEEGHPGALHHLPKEKRGRLKKQTG